jgi:hypothetical protein
MQLSYFVTLCSSNCWIELYREVKLLTQEPSKSNHCISCRFDYTRWRNLRVDPGIRARHFGRSSERHRGINWSPEPKFGRYWHLCVAEPSELFQLKYANHRYTADINSTHFKRNNPLVCRVSARYNHSSTGSKQVYLAWRRVYNFFQT